MENYKNIDFIKMEGADNMYLPKDKDIMKWFDYVEESNLEHSLYAFKNKEGDFLPIIEEKNKILFCSYLSFIGKYKDLSKNGYKYYNGSNGIKYNKGNIHNSIWVTKAGNSFVIDDLHLVSGAVYNWLIDNEFNEEICLGFVFISERTGNIRKSAALLFDNGLPTEREYNVTKELMGELKRLYELGDQLKSCPTQTINNQ